MEGHGRVGPLIASKHTGPKKKIKTDGDLSAEHSLTRHSDRHETLKATAQ